MLRSSSCLVLFITVFVSFSLFIASKLDVLLFGIRLMRFTFRSFVFGRLNMKNRYMLPFILYNVQQTFSMRYLFSHLCFNYPSRFSLSLFFVFNFSFLLGVRLSIHRYVHEFRTLGKLFMCVCVNLVIVNLFQMHWVDIFREELTTAQGNKNTQCTNFLNGFRREIDFHFQFVPFSFIHLLYWLLYTMFIMH